MEVYDENNHKVESLGWGSGDTGDDQFEQSVHVDLDKETVASNKKLTFRLKGVHELTYHINN